MIKGTRLYRSHWPNGTSVYSRLYVDIEGADLTDSHVWCGNFDSEDDAELAADNLDAAYGGWIDIDDALICVETPYAVIIEIIRIGMEKSYGR